MKNVSLHTLSNGLQVAIFNFPHLKSTEVFALVRSGCIYETPQNNGISHFVEHLILKSTKKYDSKDKIREAVKKIAASRNGHTTMDRVMYPVRVIDDYFNEGVEILKESITQPLLKKEDFEEERGVILTEIGKTKDNIDRIIRDEVQKNAFQGSMSLYNAGDYDSVKRISHKELVDYYSNFYNPKNMVLAVITSLGDKRILEQLELNFGKWQAKSERIQNPRTEVIKQKEKLSFLDKDTEQIHFALGLETVKGIEEKKSTSLSMVSYMLWDRLFQSLRTDKSLIYGINVWHGRYYGANGLLYLKTDFKAESLQRVVKEIVLNLKNFKTSFKEEELLIAKNNMAASTLFSYEQPKNVAFRSAYSLLYTGDLMDLEEEHKKIFQITVKDIVDIAEQFLDIKNMSFVLAGNIDNKMKKFLQEQIKS